MSTLEDGSKLLALGYEVPQAPNPEIRPEQVQQVATHLENQTVLENSHPLVVRGVEGIGSTSLALAAAAKLTTPCVYLDLNKYIARSRNSFSVEYSEDFGLAEVAQLLANMKSGVGNNLQLNTLRVEEIQRQIRASRITPLQFLDYEMAEWGQKSGVIVDSAQRHTGQGELTKMIAKDLFLPRLNPVVIASPSRLDVSSVAANLPPNASILYPRSLNSNEAAILLNQPLEGTGTEWSPEVVEAIVALAGGRPAEIRLLAQRILTPEFQTGVNKGIIDVDVVNAFRAQITADFAQTLPQLIAQYRELTIQHLTEAEGTNLLMVAAGHYSHTGEGYTEADAQQLAFLENLTLIERSPDGTYQINGGNLIAYLRQRFLSKQYSFI